ncbi:type III-B CRISPR module-associated Cmr3 family protein [Numidum massiliense]|uniref:type III-B CRISPR module-associated Cmr3 family protein n=1 Tax=Numidum massiliense TaxID=1522315 RepID=UPI0006D595D3|nr:type III-B CRISPR module-associated Cmr3 family protein [Numidum massiliense]
MKRLRLKPVDTFFFKGHATADAGVHTVADGMFPPRSNTVYGALRAAYIHQHSTFEDFAAGKDDAVKEWMGTPESFGSFRQALLLLMKNDELLLPLPLDCQVLKEEKLEVHPLTLTPDDLPSSNNASLWRLRASSNKKSASAAGKFVPMRDWKKLLLSGESTEFLLAAADLIQRSPKVGIHLNKERRAEKHYFYQQQMLTMVGGCQLAVYADPCPDFADVPFARLGAESRPWTIAEEDHSWTLWEEEELAQLRQQLAATKLARIVLLSPAVWGNGSRPGSFNEETKEIELSNGLRAEVLTAAVGRPDMYGGWDIVKHRPKERRQMVPAGTVLYVRIAEADIDRFIALANGFTLTDEGAHEGFGFAVAAGVPNL